MPSTRPEYWCAKFDRTVARDREQAVALEAAGWTVITVWECETKKPGPLRAFLEASLTRRDRPADGVSKGRSGSSRAGLTA